MKTRILIVLLLTALTLGLFWPATGHDFVFDDLELMLGEPHLTGGLTGSGVRWALTEAPSALYAPLYRLSHMTDFQLFGRAPRGHHLTSILLHAVNTVLLFLALTGLTGAPWRSGAVAALFAVHPLHVEPVAWVAGRADLLAAFFGLLMLLAWTRHLRQGGRLWSLAAAVAFLLGMLSKPLVVMLPLALLLLDYWPLGRLHRNPRRSALLREKAGLFLVMAATTAVTLSLLSRSPLQVSVQDYPLPARVATVLVSYATYLVKTFRPVGLAVFYPLTGGNYPWWEVAGAGVLLAGATATAAAARRLPYLATGWFWFLGTLLPVIGVYQGRNYLMADRYSYLPLTGVFVIAVWGLADLAARWRRGRPAGAIVVVVALILACLPVSRAQVLRWRDTVTLFEHALAVTEENWMAHYNVGQDHHARGQLQQAARHYAETIRIKPEYAEAIGNLGLLRQQEGRLGEAEPLLRRAIELKPELMQPHLNLARLALQQGRLAQAAESFTGAVRARPDSAELRAALGSVLLSLGRREEAAVQLREALRLDPANREAEWQLRGLAQP